MRIIGGSLKGRTLYGFKGEEIRPTSDNARESLFNILGDIEDAEFLDLCSGTGAIGIEAFSRGAKVTFNDAAAESVALTRANLERMGADAAVSRADACSFISSARKKYDIIFFDPPYNSAIIASVLNVAGAALNDNGIFILENEKPWAGIAQGLVLTDVRRYGRAVFSFFKKQKAGSAVYAGTFDPVTAGHINSIVHALSAFKKVFVTVGENPDKTQFFSLEERVKMLNAALKDCGAETLVYSDFKSAKEYGAFLRDNGVRYYVRGIRDERDFYYEKKAERRNAVIYPEIETAYIVCEEQFKNVSSSMVKSMLKKGKDVSEFIPLSARQTFEEIMRKRAGKK